MEEEPLCPGEPAAIDLALGIFLLVGTLVSYLPQHIKLLMKKSHVGLSINKVSIGTMTATSGCIYYASLQYHEAFLCCGPEVSGLECFANVMNFLQLVIILLSDIAILFLFMLFFDKKWLDANGFDGNKLYKESLFVTAVVCLYMVRTHLFASLSLRPSFPLFYSPAFCR